MPPPPSATYERLREYIAERMRMSTIDQPLILMELLSHRCPCPEHRTWPGGSWKRMVGGEGDVCPTATACLRLLGAELSGLLLGKPHTSVLRGSGKVPETPATLKSSGYRPCRHGAW